MVAGACNLTPKISLRRSDFSEESYIGIDVTILVKKGVLNPSTYFGWMFKLDDETPFSYLKFASSDSPSPYLWPRLTIIYTCKAVVVQNPNRQSSYSLKLGNGYAIFDIEEDFLDLSLFGIDGQLISRIPLKGLMSYKLDLNNLSKGIYTAVLQASNHTESVKIRN